MNEMEVRNTFFQWLFKRSDIPINIFDNIEIKTLKEVNIPGCLISANAVFTWSVKWERKEPYLSHINDNGKAVYKNNTYTAHFRSNGSEKATPDMEFSLTKDEGLRRWLAHSDGSASSEKFFLQLQDERNFMSFDEKVSEVEKNLHNEFSFILGYIQEREKQNIDMNYNWQLTLFDNKINFDSISISGTQKIALSLWFVEYIYDGKTYYWLKNPNNAYLQYTSPPKMKSDQGVENKILDIVLWWMLIPFGAAFIMYLIDYFGGFSFIIGLILGYIYVGIYRMNKSAEKRNEHRRNFVNHIQNNRHDLCPIFDLVPNVNSDTDDNRKRKKDLVDLRESYISRKEEFIKKYEALGYKEFNSEVGLYFAMKKDSHVVTIYIDEEKMKIVEQEGEQQS